MKFSNCLNDLPVRERRQYSSETNLSCRALPVTARTLETIIRLATAAAKVRLSFDIEAQDVEEAKVMLNYVLRDDMSLEDSVPLETWVKSSICSLESE